MNKFYQFNFIIIRNLDFSEQCQYLDFLKQVISLLYMQNIVSHNPLWVKKHFPHLCGCHLFFRGLMSKLLFLGFWNIQPWKLDNIITSQTVEGILRIFFFFWDKMKSWRFTSAWWSEKIDNPFPKSKYKAGQNYKNNLLVL